MVFTRSVSETGATVAVVSHLQTAPVVIVDWVRILQNSSLPNPGVTPLVVGLGCGFLILFSFLILFALRMITRGKGRY